ncbi:EndoU domain-containing protein [Streptomyces sp. NPDC006430]|uniref:EndoU domain-containing protein n=1 Tax=Streptomyces sp. NPDC006430 TaxID=3154299 RepID=UPI0033A9B82E
MTESPSAQFVGTTRNRELWYGDRRYRYQIDSSRNGDDQNHTGVDVNGTIDMQLDEQEVAFTGSLDAQTVVSVYDRELSRTGTWNQATETVEWVAGELWGSGEVSTDRWIPFGGGGGGVGSQAFEFTPAGPEVRKAQRLVDGELVEFDAPWQVRRPPMSGERTQVGYSWASYRGGTPAQDTVQLIRRVHLVTHPDDVVTADQVAALRRDLRQAMESVVNQRDYRLPLPQADQVTGPQLPGPRLRVDVRFVDSEDQADTVVRVRSGLPGPGRPMVQDTWFTDVHPAAYVHEIVHGLGVRDDEADPRVLLTPGGGQRVVLRAWQRGATPVDDVLRVTRRVHLVPDGVGAERMGALREDVARAVEEEVNGRGHRVPVVRSDGMIGPQWPGPLLRMDVEFVASADQADTVVQVRDGAPEAGRPMSRDDWFTGVHAAAHVRRLLPRIGVRDDGARRRVLLIPDGRKSQVLGEDESSLMGAFTDPETQFFVLTSDHLQQIADVLTPHLHHNTVSDLSARTAPVPGTGEGATLPEQAAVDTPPPVDVRMVHPAEHAHPAAASFADTAAVSPAGPEPSGSERAGEEAREEREEQVLPGVDPSAWDRLRGYVRGIWERITALPGAAAAWAGRLWQSVVDWLAGRRAAAAVEIARAEVRPDYRQRWVGAAPPGGALDIRRFEARRYRLPTGEFESRALVRVFLRREDGDSVTDESLAALERRAQEAVDERYNGGLRLPGGDLFRVDLEFVGTPEAAHHTVTVHAEYERANHQNWGLTTQADTLAHEVGHLLGLDDEYRESYAYGGRTVYQDKSLMSLLEVDHLGRPFVDADQVVHSRAGGRHRMRVTPRHLRQFGSAIEAALGTVRLRVDGEVVFSTAETLQSRADGLPTRAHFSLDTRRAVLYGEPRTGGGGYLPPSAMSDRPRPVVLEGTAKPNGTYRAEYPGLSVRPDLADRSHPVAGDLHVRPRQPKRGQMMFPAHWTEDDAVYAAEQAYLHALRQDTVHPFLGRPGVYVWTGEYDGVRITGELSVGRPRVVLFRDRVDEGDREILGLRAGDSVTFTGFRPSDDQPDTPGPAHASPPPPAAHQQSGPAFSRRVEDVAWYGDRRTRTGAYHEPKLGREELARYYGLRITPVRTHDNGTYEADVWFLDPALRPGEDQAGNLLNWYQHQDGDQHVIFPKKWRPDQLQAAVERAHAAAIAANTVWEVDARGTYHWVGDVAGVRIEGLVRDGHHVAYRPTQMQPFSGWPDREPVGEAAGSPVSFTREGQVVPFAVRHVLFDNGQQGLHLTKRIHLAVAPGIDDTSVSEAWSRLEKIWTAGYSRFVCGPRRDGALVRLSLARVESSEEAHHSFLVDDLHTLSDAVVDVLPDVDELRSFTGDVLDRAAPTADAWRLSAGTDEADLYRALDLLDLADPFSRPTTLREPDPADSGPRSEDRLGPLDGLADSAQRDSAGRESGHESDVAAGSDVSAESGTTGQDDVFTRVESAADERRSPVVGRSPRRLFLPSASAAPSTDTAAVSAAGPEPSGAGPEVQPDDSGPVEPDGSAFAGAVEIARVKVQPDDRREWVGAPYGGALEVRRFEARRYRLPAGDFGTRVVVRVFLDRVGGAPITEDQLTEVARRAQQGVDERYNGGLRLPSGDLFRVDLEFVGTPEAAHHTVTVHAGYGRVNHGTWELDTKAHVLAHEVGHLLGLADEYRKSDEFGGRTVYLDEPLMGAYQVDHWGRPLVDADHLAYSLAAGPTRMGIKPRHLRQIGSAIEAALGTVRLRVDGEVVFSTAETLQSRADGLPTRAHFSLDTRRAVLYGEPRTGGGGYLPPSAMSDRPRPVVLEGTAKPNGTYRAEYPGLSVRPDLADRSHPVAGDLHVRPRQPKRGQMMFPAHWTEDDAVYAAEQAYLHALRQDTVHPFLGRPGVYVWTGEYDGVRITGELSIGRPGVHFFRDYAPEGDREIPGLRAGDSVTFTGFRPSDDQPDTPSPAHASPPPPAARPQRPAFSRRVEDVARYGDRRTRTGAYHEPKADQAAQEDFYDLRITPGRTHDNGTYEADVWFLDPALRPFRLLPGLRQVEPPTSDPSNWRQHRDGDQHVMFPKEWKPHQVLMAVEWAHAAAIAANTVREVDDRGTYHWVGDAKEVRLEGLVRDGHHVAYRPTQMQPFSRWPDREPLGEAAGSPVSFTREGQVVPFAVRHVLFDNGQQGLHLTKRIHLAVAPGIDDTWLNEVWSRLQPWVTDAYRHLARGPRTDAALVRLSLARASRPEEAHHSFPFDGLPALVDAVRDVLPDVDELRSLTGDLLDSAAPTADAWRPSAGTDEADLQRALDLLDLADPFSRPTTLREPDPADSGTGSRVSPFDSEGDSEAESGAWSEDESESESGAWSEDESQSESWPWSESEFEAESESESESEQGTESGPDAGERRHAVGPMESELNVHRPPRIDRSMSSSSLSSSSEDGPVRFTDGSRLPEYLTTGYGTGEAEGRTYGHSQVTLRGADIVVQEIGERLGGRSAMPGLSEVLDDLRQALGTSPQIFHGDGYESPSFGNSRAQVLRVVTRPHGNWERFTDPHDEQVKVDAGQRSQITMGAGHTVSARRRAAAGVTVGPLGGIGGVGRLGGTMGVTRSYEYGLRDQTLSQVETRMAQRSRLHLDDVQYEVFLSGEAEPIGSFTVRNGLMVRLADSQTSPAEPGRVPHRMTLGARSDYRLVHTEGYGPVRPLRDRLAAELGVVPGSAAYEYITAFFSSESFHRAADRLARGSVAADALFGEDGSPLGAFVVERVVPGEAELLTESRAAEMRNTIQQTVNNERTLSRTSSWGINVTAGPSMDLGSWGRLMVGASAGHDRSTTHSSAFGGSGSRRIVGRAKNVPTVLYLVRKTVHVRRSGASETIPFETWSLDRMTHTEARRLAGWDDGTTLRARNGNAPHVPVYLTEENPVVLGMTRPEAFTYDDADLVSTGGRPQGWLEAFSDKAIRAAAETYPGVLAPLEEFGDPTDSRWHDPQHYSMALANTLRVMNALSHHSIAGNLEVLTATGLSIGLDVPPGVLSRSHLSLRIRGELTGRRYEGTQNDLILRTSVPGTERLDGSQSVTRTSGAGLDVALRGIVDHASISVGPSWARSRGRETQHGATVSYEPLVASSSPSHLYSYQLALTAEIESFSRFRTAPRALSLGMLGARPQESTDLVGGGTGDPFVGRVVLAVPDEHTPPTDPRAEVAARAEPEGHVRDAFGDQPYQTLSVGSPAALARAAEALMAGLSGGSWHFTRSGAAPHDAMVRFFQAQSLTAGFDQASGSAGSRLSLFAEGFLRHRVGELVHHMRVFNLRVRTKPLRIATELAVGGDLHMAGVMTTARSSGLSLTGSGMGGTELTTLAGLQYRRGSSRAETTGVIRTVTWEVNRDDGGYKVLVSGDIQHDIVGSVRPEGLLRPAFAPFYRDSRGERQLTVPSGYLGHVPEKSAHRLGLLNDGLGEVPRYTSHAWGQARWWHDHPFGSYPVNSLDTTAVQARIDEQLRQWKVDDADRERVRSLVTPRALRALREQMASTGTAARARVGRWLAGIRVGSRTGSLRVELIAEEPRFDGLDHGVAIEDTRTSTVTEVAGNSAGSSRMFGANGMEGVATASPDAVPRPGDLQAVRATLDGGFTSAELRSHSQSRTQTRRRTFYAREPHAEYLTRYRLRLTLDTGNGRHLSVEDEVGTLREQVPLSMTVPDRGTGQADDPLRPPTVDAPARSAVLLGQEGATERAIDAWRSLLLPNGTHGPFQPPSTGFQVRRIVGRDTLKQAAVLAIAEAYGTSVTAATAGGGPRQLTAKELDAAAVTAGDTRLTRPGTASALALDNGTSDAALTAFFEDSGTADGYVVPGLNEEGGAHGQYRLYSKPDLTRAVLLAVVPDTTMESAERDTAARGTTVSRTSGHDSSLGAQTVVSVGKPGSVAPFSSVTGPSAAESDRRVSSGAQGAQLTIKLAGRSFVFAIPTAWLGVADVDRPNCVFGHIRRMRAVETQTRIIALVREDLAREWGLVDDGNFPPAVADAWTQVTKAGKAWAAADDAYWAKRRALAGPGESTPETDDSELLEPLLQRAEDAAGEFHRVRAETDRLTRWHRLPPEAHRPGEPRLRAGVPEPPAVKFTFTAGDTAVKAEHPVYEALEGAPGDLGQLVSPEGGLYTLYDVPADGDGFFHAVAEGLHHADPGLLAERVPATDRQQMADTLRRLLAEELSRHADLLEFTSPDTRDRFSGDELGAGGMSPMKTLRLSELKPGTMALSTPEWREFSDSGHLPLHAELPGRQRAGLAREQLLRGGDATDGAGWDHGAADLLPALAARHFGVRVTVVGADGRFQDFWPSHSEAGNPTEDQLPHIVLHLSNRHYRPALPAGEARRQPALFPALSRTAEGGRKADAAVSATPQNRPPRPAYATAPWAADSAAWRTTRRAGTTGLTGPDGTAHTLREPTGDGNGFWSAVTTGLRPQGVTERGLLTRPLPEGARLDRGTPFTDEELAVAGLSAETIESVRRRRADGGLPHDLELTAWQERALIRAQLLTTRGWNEATERTAVAQVASYGVNVTVVGEDGTFSTTHAPGDGSGRPELVLYRRGREYLLAEPVTADNGSGTSPTDAETPPRGNTPSVRTPHDRIAPLAQAAAGDRQNGTGDPPPPSRAEETPERDNRAELGQLLESPAVLDTLVRRHHVEGLRYSPSVTATWDLAPRIELPLRDLALTPTDRVNLLRMHPDLFEPWVGESLARLTG